MAKIKTSEQLKNIKQQILNDFGTEENLASYWFNHGRRQIDKEVHEKYDVSYYYFKKIIQSFSWFREKTHEEIESYHLKAIQKTNLEKYGVTCNWASKDPKLNGQATTFKRYGVYKNSQSKAWRDSIKKTWDSKTADEKLAIVNKILKTKKQSRHVTHKYICNGLSFDSFPELAFYIYMSLHTNISIKRESQTFQYYFKGKSYTYIPDFEIDGHFYELKATYWLKNWNVPGTQDYAKYQCMLEHNVTVLWEEDYKMYTDWFFSHEWDKKMFILDYLSERSATAAMADLLN